MLDRDTISHQDVKSHKRFSCSIGSFKNCLERAKVVLSNECNGDFKHYEKCIDRAIEILN